MIGLTWPVPPGIDDAELDRRLFPVVDDGRARPAIDWPAIETELKRRGVTLLLLWQEYLAEQPAGYSYTRFCELHKAWKQTVTATMRQTHLAGERLFVDWAGDTIGVIDPATGNVYYWNKITGETTAVGESRPTGMHRVPVAPQFSASKVGTELGSLVLWGAGLTIGFSLAGAAVRAIFG